MIKSNKNSTFCNIKLFLSIATSLLMLFFVIVSYMPLKISCLNSASADTVTYLKSPTQIVANGTYALVYDSQASVIQKYSLTSKELVGTSASLTGITKLKIYNDYCYALSSNHVISKININTLAIQTLTTSSTEQIIDFAIINDTTFYLLNQKTNYQTILYSILEDGRLSTNNAINLDDSASGLHLTNIEYFNNTIYVVANSLVAYTLTQTEPMGAYKPTQIVDISNINGNSYSEITQMVSSGGSILLLISKETNGIKNSYIYNHNNVSQKITSLIGNFSALYKLSSSEYYLCDNANQKIVKYNGGGSASSYTNFVINNVPSQPLNNIANQQNITLKENASVYSAPYSIEPLFNLQEGACLTIIANNEDYYSNFHYCILTQNNQNYYCYLPKSTNYNTISKTAVSVSAKTIGIGGNNVYSLPSSIKDSNNQLLATIENQELVTITVAQNIYNNNNEIFNIIQLSNGTTGYILINQITTTYKTLNVEKIICNAKTKRKTTIYLSDPSTANYTAEELDSIILITLDPNTRIYLHESVKPNQDYIQVTYQNNQNESFVGYIKTADIDPDGLTTMQTLGIILVVINIAILVIILVARKKVQGTNTTKILR